MTSTAAHEVPETGLRELLLWIVRLRRRVRVEGRSMEPVLQDGQTVLVRPLAAGERPVVGDLVLARHPFRRSVHLLKRVGRVDGEGRLELLGDNPPESTDSRQLGPVAAERLLGLVTSRW